MEPSWLRWAKEIQAVAQTGLTFSENHYDKERYEALRAVAAEMMAAGSDRTPETSDGGWTLPGGWADVNQTPAQCVVREIFEESGFQTRAVKLAAALDRTRQGHQPPHPFHVYKLFFLCEIEGGQATPSHETSEVGFFAEDAIPAGLSLARTTAPQIDLMFRHWRERDLPTVFE